MYTRGLTHIITWASIRRLRQGNQSLLDRSPYQTQAQIEAAVVRAKEKRGHGRKRLASYLRWEKGGVLPSTGQAQTSPV